MSKGSLSQAEIDALMGNSGIKDSTNKDLTDIEKDLVGEVGNISMSTAATTLSSILNKKVLITTPRVSIVDFKKIVDDCAIPKVVATIEFKEGLTGDNLLMVDIKDASIIADLMMGGDGSNPSEEFTELELSAVGEAMNQMIGSASTSMATMFGIPIDISPPEVEVWDTNRKIDFEKLNEGNGVCKIAFDLEVEGLIKSEIMQVFDLNSTYQIVRMMMGETEEAVEEIQMPEPEPQVAYEPQVVHEPQREVREEKIIVKKPAFPSLHDEKAENRPPRNLDLIMDVPLEFSVVLGKSKKTIKEILSFGNGSVVELNKLADEPLEIYVNGKLIAQGEVVVINENFGVRITNILSKEQRVKNL